MPSQSFNTGSNTARYLPNVDRLDRPSSTNANLPTTYATLSAYNQLGAKADLYGLTSSSSANAALIAAALRKAEEERARLELLRKQREEALRNAQAMREDQAPTQGTAVGPAQTPYERFKALQEASRMGAEGTFFKSSDMFPATRGYRGPTAETPGEAIPAYASEMAQQGVQRMTSLNPALGLNQEPAWMRAAGFVYQADTQDQTGPRYVPSAETVQRYGRYAGLAGQYGGFRPFVPQTLEERKQRLEELYQAFPYLRDDTGDLSLSSIPDADEITRSAQGRAISQEDFKKGQLSRYTQRDLAADYRRRQIEIWGEPRQIFYDDPTNIASQVVNGVTVYFDARTGERLDTNTRNQFLREEFGYFGETGPGSEGPTGKNIEYLGLVPGDVPIRPIPDPPPLDAPYSEWVKYGKMLDDPFPQPLYRPDMPFRELSFMDAKTRAKFQKDLARAGLYESTEVYTPGIITTREIELMTGLMAEANKNGLTWQEMMDIEIVEGRRRAAAAAAAAGGGGGGGGGGTNIYTQIQYTQTSIAQARSLLVSVLRDALGRAPTDEEVQRFVLLLNKAESKSPTKTVTKTTTMGDRTRGVSRTTPSTVDAEALAQQFAEEIGGGAEFKAKSDYDYLSGLFESLGAPGV